MYDEITMCYNKWFENIISRDLIYKKRVRNKFLFPRLKSIYLTINDKSVLRTSRSVFFSMVILEILINQKSKLCLTKKSIAAFRLQKSSPVGSLLTLRKQNKELFLSILLFFIFPKMNIATIILNRNNLNIGVKTLISISQLGFLKNFFLNKYGFNINLNFNGTNISFFLNGLQLKKNQ